MRTLSRLQFSLLAIATGAIAGLGAALFRAMIGFVHNVAFLAILSPDYNANLHTPPSPWGGFILFVPVLGAIIVVFLVKNFALEAKGTGVPELLDTIYYGRGHVRPVVALVKALASAVSIGTGGSVGREGPIMQIGSSLGGGIGQWLRAPVWQQTTLICCGAAGGIGATFNTPVGGVLFAVEIMMREVSARTLVPVALATATATYIGRLIFGDHPTFVFPPLEAGASHATELALLLAYAIFGGLTGLAATAFIRTVYGVEDFFAKAIKGSYYRQHVLGMLLVGTILAAMMATTGHYYVEGVGYSTIQEVVSGGAFSASFLAVLCLLKLATTALTLGSGASGGIFSPALFIGATFGGAFAMVLQKTLPMIGASPPAFAVIGMAAMVGGTNAAALSAITMIFEMTRDFSIVVPMTISVMLSYGVRRAFCTESMYKMKLARRDHPLPDALEANAYLLRRADELMVTHFAAIHSRTRLQDLPPLAARHARASVFVVIEQNHLIGFIWREAALCQTGRRDETAVREIARRDYAVVHQQLRFSKIIEVLRDKRASLAFVASEPAPLKPDQLAGFITADQLVGAITSSADADGA